MNIQRQLPQFTNEHALIIVAGKQSGVLYYASNGSIEELGTIRVETPTYSDREGFFATGKGSVARSGSSLREMKQEIRKRFAKELASKVRATIKAQSIDSLYVIISRQTAEEFISAFPVSTQKLIKKIRYGNLTELHPFDILKHL